MTAVLTDEQKTTIKAAGAAGPLRRTRRDRLGRDLAGRRRRGVRHRGRDPGRRRTRNGALTIDHDQARHRHSGRQADPGRRRDDGQLDRLRHGQGRPGAGRHRADLQLRPRAGHHPPDRQAAAGRAAGARARRHRRRAPGRAARRRSASTSTGSTGSCTRSPTATRRPCSAASSSTGPWDDVAQAVQVSAYSLMSLAQACRPLMADGGSVVGLTFDATVAWPAYDWMGVAKAGLESCSRYLARDLGPEGIRVNLVSAGPLRTLAAKAIPGFEELESMWSDRVAARLGQHRPRAHRQGGLRAALRLLPGHDRRDRARRRRLPRDGRLSRRRSVACTR